jgi:hypothetical protein
MMNANSVMTLSCCYDVFIIDATNEQMSSTEIQTLSKTSENVFLV